MQVQEIIKDGDKEFFLIALPCTKEFFVKANLSDTEKSITVYMKPYFEHSSNRKNHLMINKWLVKGKCFKKMNYTVNDIVSHIFKRHLDNVSLQALKIPLITI